MIHPKGDRLYRSRSIVSLLSGMNLKGALEEAKSQLGLSCNTLELDNHWVPRNKEGRGCDESGIEENIPGYLWKKKKLSFRYRIWVKISR